MERVCGVSPGNREECVCINTFYGICLPLTEKSPACCAADYFRTGCRTCARTHGSSDRELRSWLRSGGCTQLFPSCPIAPCPANKARKSCVALALLGAKVQPLPKTSFQRHRARNESCAHNTQTQDHKSA